MVEKKIYSPLKGMPREALEEMLEEADDTGETIHPLTGAVVEQGLIVAALRNEKVSVEVPDKVKLMRRRRTARTSQYVQAHYADQLVDSRLGKK